MNVFGKARRINFYLDLNGGNLSNSFKLNKPGQQLGWRKQLRLMLFFWICLPRKVLSRLIDFSIWIISTKLSQFALKIYHGY